MNFNYSEDQQAIQDVAIRMFRDLCTDEQIKAIYNSDIPLHQELWQQLAQSGLLGTALPSQFGGSEMGMTELCIIFEAQGSAVAPIPILESVVECALPIAQFASDELKQRLLPGVSSGECILTSVRPYSGLLNKHPLNAQAEKEGWVLNGDSNLVGYASVANGFLVTAQLDENSQWVGYVDAQSEGITVVTQQATSGELTAHLSFSNVQVAAENVIATNDEADTLLAWQAQRTYAAMAAMQVGVLKEGLRRAAEYTSERKQFGRPLAGFQAVAQQAADGFMAIEALRSVYWRLLDVLDNGCDTETQGQLAAHSTKFWICEAGHIAAHVFLHIHGGIGQDLDYPLHRFFSWAKKNELYLGTANDHSVALGKLIQQDIDAVLA